MQPTYLHYTQCEQSQLTRSQSDQTYNRILHCVSKTPQVCLAIGPNLDTHGSIMTILMTLLPRTYATKMYFILPPHLTSASAVRAWGNRKLCQPGIMMSIPSLKKFSSIACNVRKRSINHGDTVMRVPTNGRIVFENTHPA